MDKSKVVHARIPIEDVVGCYDILEAVGNKNVTALPVGSALARTLHGFLEGARKSEHIPTWSDPRELAFRYEEIFGPDAGDRVFSDFEFVVDNESNPSNDGPSLGSAIDDAVQQIEEKGVRLDGDLDNPEYDPSKDNTNPDVASITLDMKDCMSFDEIREESPKDRFVVLCEEDSSIIPVIRFVYSKLPTDQWGSARAELMIEEIMSCEIHVV